MISSGTRGHDDCVVSIVVGATRGTVTRGVTFYTAPVGNAASSERETSAV